MSLASITALSFLTTNLLGLAASAYLDKHGLDPEISVQTAPRKVGRFRRRLPLILFNLMMMTAGAWLGLTLVADLFDPTWPGAMRFAAQFLLILVVDDLVFYAVHRAMHANPWLYKRLHKLHHEAYAPLPSEYLYVHPGELSAGTFGVLIGAAVVYLTFGAIGFPAFLAYALFRNLHELDIHSGIRSTFSASIPFLAPAEHHDLHHHQPRWGNYASMLTVWDDAFGTRTHNDAVRGRRIPARESTTLTGA